MSERRMRNRAARNGLKVTRRKDGKLQYTCTCPAYPFPHRENGGRCFGPWPEEWLEEAESEERGWLHG